MTALVATTVVATASCSTGTAKRLAAPPTTAAAAPTTTVPPQTPLFPLTGLPAPGGPPSRPALSVKIDNVDPARPQSGVNDADLVYEELVEGGNTRLFAVYQSHDSPSVGPIRSARPVDADLLHALRGGIFAFSGAAAGEIAPVKDHGQATLISNDAGSPGFSRDHRRKAPFNLFSSTSALYAAGVAAGNRQGLPPSLFQYGAASPQGPVGEEVDLTMGIRLSSAWRWNASSQLYERAQNGQPDVLADGSMITANNVVIMSVQIRGTGIFDTVREEDPFVVVIGSGPCWVLRNGRLVAGQWQRPTLDSPTQLTTSGGAAVALQPGRTWVELLPVPSQPQFH
jgi:hypothetical protein